MKKLILVGFSIWLVGCKSEVCFKVKKENCTWSHSGPSCNVELENGQNIYSGYIRKGDYACMPEKF